MTDVATINPTTDLVRRIQADDFKSQIAVALPGNVTPERFIRATVTAIMENPDLVEADRNSVFQSAMRAAQDGLLPNGKEAALVIYNTKDKKTDSWVKKAQYLPMIAGLRKVAAEYGWAMTTEVVFENDDFDYTLGLNPDVKHKPAKLGMERGDPIGAYAVATHKDGRKLMEVMTEADIQKVRASSKSKDRGPWVDWPDRMREKTVGKRLFAKLPLDEKDRDRFDSVLRADDVADDPVAALYGPDASFVEDDEPLVGEYEEPIATVDDDDVPVVISADAAATLDDQLVAAELALDAVIPGSAMKGQSLRRLLEARPKSDSWWRNALSHDWQDAEFEAAVAAVAAVYLTDLDGGKA